MKKVRAILSVLLVLVLALSFAACGGEKTPANPDAKTIVYWSMWESTEPQGIAIQEAIDAYMADTGNIVQVEFKGRTGQREGLEPALDAGQTIDLFDEDMDRVNQTWGNYIMDLEELAASTNYEATANAGLMAALRDYNGTLRSIPYQPFVFAFFYNEEIFNEAGVTSVPNTWEEFLAACEKIKNAGYYPITCDDAYITCMIGYHLGRLIGEEGVTDVVMNGNWAENPAVLEMAQAYEQLASLGYFSPNLGSNVWPSGQNGEFALGEVGMYLNGSWLPNEVRGITGDDFQWGCFSYPSVPNGVNGPETANFGGQVFAINKNSEVAPEAFELICYITQGQYDALLSEMSLGIPADTSNTNWPAQLAAVEPVMANLSGRFSWAVNVEANNDITPAIKENFTKLCAGEITAEQFVAAMEAASN